jgi:hypothetical protein
MKGENVETDDEKNGGTDVSTFIDDERDDAVGDVKDETVENNEGEREDD